MVGAVNAAPAKSKAAPAAAPLTEAQVDARVDALMAQMTTEEKVGQLIQYFNFGGTGEQAAPLEKEVAAGRAGSLLFMTDPVQINRMQRIAVEQSRLKIPLLFGFDVIHGLRTVMPVPIAVAASWDPKVAEAGQTVAAAEARAVGIHWAFAPMVDIARDQRWGRMVEGAGEDPFLGSAMAAAQVRGFQGAYLGAPGRIIAGPKHFAGYGASLGGRDYDEVNISDNELWNVYLPPFQAAIEAGAGNIMSAYMGLNGTPASGNRWLLTDVLRGRWGFKGFVVTDAGAARDLSTHGYAADDADAATRALNAGVDMEMGISPGKTAFQHLPEQIAAGKVKMADIDTAVRRVLAAKIRMGLFENPYVDVASATKVLADPAHRDVSRRAAEASFVLLHNAGNLLPLNRTGVKSIAVIGPMADSARDTIGPWVFDVKSAETVTVLAGIKAKLGAGANVAYAPGVSTPKRVNGSFFDEMGLNKQTYVEVDDNAAIAEAVAKAKASDVAVLVLGEPQNMIGEYASRSSLDLPGRQQELLNAVIATGKPVVVLLMSARPLDLKGAKPGALMNIWYPGTQGGTAVANVLFGDAAPAGRLPFSWARSVGQLPMIYSHLTGHQPSTADKHYGDAPSTPLYPFGYGLSYSTFSYANLSVAKGKIAPGESVEVSVDVKNTGTRPADEVAQLYIHQRHGSSARPVRELKGFSRITLAPGEVRKVTFRLSPKELTYWSAAKGAYVQDETVFDLYAGGDSTAPLATTLSVAKN
ncbi:beta-glucosidase BglX [Novosphingobium sp. FSY-8]|uniref:beta-glucosidase n=2 Tax=Novosphingobium ovatum TaxID=1908523 RepID=A0ABW9XHW1_9SPHN|nr:beta-glucosidase BglX [Novosphingobium ovatum]